MQSPHAHTHADTPEESAGGREARSAAVLLARVSLPANSCVGKVGLTRKDLPANRLRRVRTVFATSHTLGNDAGTRRTTLIVSSVPSTNVTPSRRPRRRLPIRRRCPGAQTER